MSDEPPISVGIPLGRSTSFTENSGQKFLFVVIATFSFLISFFLFALILFLGDAPNPSAAVVIPVLTILIAAATFAAACPIVGLVLYARGKIFLSIILFSLPFLMVGIGEIVITHIIRL